MSAAKPHLQPVWFRHWDTACHFQSWIQEHSSHGCHHHWIPFILYAPQRLAPFRWRRQQQSTHWTKHIRIRACPLTSTHVDETSRWISPHLLSDILWLRYQCLYYSQDGGFQHASNYFSDVGQGCYSNSTSTTSTTCYIQRRYDAHGKDGREIIGMTRVALTMHDTGNGTHLLRDRHCAWNEWTSACRDRDKSASCRSTLYQGKLSATRLTS